MDRMFKQFDKLMKPRIARLNEAAVKVAEAIEQRAKDNSESGRAFGQDRYDAKYTPKVLKSGQVVNSRHMKKRLKGGYQIQYVDLRMGNKRIESSDVKREGKNGALIYYQRGGDMLKYHHDGIRYKNGNEKTRSIMPKELKSIPTDIHQLALEQGGKVLK